jgi:hypothetical protein
MRVKIGDHIYDANLEPIMLILSDAEKEQIASMEASAHRYCQYPDHFGSRADPAQTECRW